MLLRTYRPRNLFGITAIALCLAAAYSPVLASQETKKEAGPSPCSSGATPACPSAPATNEIPEAHGQRAADLPDKPEPQDHSKPPSPSSQTQDRNSAILFLPVATPERLSFSDKFTIYAHQTFGPPALIFPAFAAAFGVANPKSRYPREWKDGAAAFGRLYGDSIATLTSQRTARFLTGVALHEDPRYVQSSSTSPLARTIHALGGRGIPRFNSAWSLPRRIRSR
jgi:hypothetical protein